MLGDSSNAALGSSSGDAPAPAPAISAPIAGGGSGGDEFGDRSFGGNRWPRQETIALLKIRSDMDVVFRDASVKGPLWDEVSRKLAELGYQRSAKKCKEKFENVYKYHKRTKEGRTGKADGKTYRFFDQLSALESQPSPTAFAPPQKLLPPPPPPPKPTPPPIITSPPKLTPVSHHHNNSNANSTTVTSVINAATATANMFQTPFKPNVPPANPTDVLMSNSMSSSSSTDEDTAEEDGEGEVGDSRRRRRKRKWKDFFERLMTEVIHRQEDLQKRFLDAIERREQERISREESWRIQELARINREREILAQERSVAAAKDAAVMSFLQKISDTQQIPLTTNPAPVVTTPATMPVVNIPQPVSIPVPIQTPAVVTLAKAKPVVVESSGDGEGDNVVAIRGVSGSASSSRWPKTEVHDLIKLRTNMDEKYQENGPKGPLWEEISAAMRRLGYNRNAKRCKEKWENINKYFKKVKESNKRRPEDSKTCPYFTQLDAIYQQRSNSGAGEINAVPLMVQPEQQWPPIAPPPAMTTQAPMESSVAAAGAPGESEPPTEDYDDEDIDEDEEEEDDEAGNNYELVASKPNSVGAE